MKGFWKTFWLPACDGSGNKWAYAVLTAIGAAGCYMAARNHDTTSMLVMCAMASSNFTKLIAGDEE